MIRVNPRLLKLKPYKVASHKIWSVPASERSRILKLDWNEATIPPSPKVREALKKLISEEDFLHLYPSTFNDALMQAMSAYTGLPQEDLQYFASSDALHEYISRAFLGEGKKVMVLWPSYDNFRLTAESTGASMCYSEMDRDFVFSPEQFTADLAREKPDMAYICNPNNPSGTLIPPETIGSFTAGFPDTVFLLDEAYIEFADSPSCSALVRDRDNLLVTRTMSKAFGLANIRFGYLAASEANIQAISRIRNPKNITTFTQTAALAAFEDAAYMRTYVKEVCRARERFVTEMNREPLSRHFKAFPSRGNFVLVRCDSEKTKAAILAWYESRDIYVRNVSQSESLKDCVRVSIGTIEQTEKVIEATKLAIECGIL